MLALVIAQHYPGEGQSRKTLCVFKRAPLLEQRGCPITHNHKYISKRYVDVGKQMASTDSGHMLLPLAGFRVPERLAQMLLSKVRVYLYDGLCFRVEVLYGSLRLERG